MRVDAGHNMAGSTALNLADIVRQLDFAAWVGTDWPTRLGAPGFRAPSKINASIFRARASYRGLFLTKIEVFILLGTLT